MNSEHNARIAGEWWVVAFEKIPKHAQAMGLCAHEYQHITVDSRLSRADERSTLFHEFAHAVCPWLTEEHIQQVEVAMMEADRVWRERGKKRAPPH